MLNISGEKGDARLFRGVFSSENELRFVSILSLDAASYIPCRGAERIIYTVIA